MWELTVPSTELNALRQRFLVGSTLRRSDGVQVRVIHPEPPGEGARPATPTLEDAYLLASAPPAAREGEAAEAAA